MSEENRATAFLTRRGVTFSLHTYDYAPVKGAIGKQAASAMGEHPSRILKTVMVEIDNHRAACAVIPVDHKVNLKKLAALLDGRNAKMMKPEDAETVSGFRIGGISPFGQRQILPTVFAEQAMNQEEVYLNAGEQGMVVKMSPHRAVEILQAKIGNISSD